MIKDNKNSILAESKKSVGKPKSSDTRGNSSAKPQMVRPKVKPVPTTPKKDNDK